MKPDSLTQLTTIYLPKIIFFITSLLPHLIHQKTEIQATKTFFFSFGNRSRRQQSPLSHKELLTSSQKSILKGWDEL